MIRWFAAIAPQSSAASVEPRSNRLTNSPSARWPPWRNNPQKHTPPPGWKNPLAPQQPLASARWLLGGVAATLRFGGGLRLHHLLPALLAGAMATGVSNHHAPSRPLRPSAGMKYDEISFDATETGILQLNGWWIPAEPTRRYAADTLLLLHDGSGSLSDTLPQLQALHNLGINIFAFDYRGFGKSLNVHPSEASTYEDADAAWRYLTDTRHLSPSTHRPRRSGTGRGYRRRDRPAPSAGAGADPRRSLATHSRLVAVRCAHAATADSFALP